MAEHRNQNRPRSGFDAMRTPGPSETRQQLAFERLARLAMRFLDVPVCLIAIAGDEQQVLVYHSPDSPVGDLSTFAMALSDSPCRTVIETREPLAISDTRENVRTCDRAAVTEHGFNAYLGVPLLPGSGEAVGAFGVASFEPRNWSSEEFDVLQDLAPSVLTEIELIEATVKAEIQEQITESQRQRFEEDTQFYQHIVEAVGQSVVVSDMERRVVYGNRAAEQALGWKTDDVRGQDIRDLVPAEHFREKSSEIGTFVRASGNPWSGEFVLQRTDGTTFPALVTLAPMLDKTGEIAGTIGIYTDITELKHSEREIRLYKHLLDAVGQAVSASNLDGQIIYWNAAAERLLGWKPVEAIGRHIHELIVSDDHREHAAQIREAARRGEAWSGEFPLRARDGTEIPSIITIAPVHDEHGEVAGVIGVYTDIGELKRTERELRFHKDMVDAVGQAVIANDLNRRIIYWNNAAERMFGWSIDEVIGRDLYDVLPAPVAVDLVRTIGESVRRGESWSGDVMLRRRDGSTFPSLASVAPVYSADGEMIGVIAALSDITAIKETEQELRFHKHIVDAVGQAVVVSDVDGNITYWNRAAEETYGWRSEEVLGKSVLDILPAEEGRDTAAEITRQIASGGAWSGEFFVKHRDGSTFTAYFTDSPIQDSQGEIIGVLGVSQDITERKEYERQIEFHKTMLDTVGQAVLATDDQFRITYWNRAAEDLYGWTAEEALGTSLLSLYPRQSTGLYQAVNVIEVLSRKGTWTGEMTSYHKDGTEIAILVTASAILDENGNQSGLLAAAADITSRKQVEEALRESNHRVIQILESMGDGFISVNRDWTLTYVNRQAEHLLQRDRTDLISRNVWDAFPGTSELLFFQKYAEAFDTGQSVSFAEFYPHLELWFEVHAYPSGENLSIFFRDVTERREAEIAIRNAEERYRTLVEQLPAMTFISSPDDVTIVQYASPQIFNVLGYTQEEWLSDPNFWIEQVHPEDRPRVIEQDRISNETKLPFTMEYRVRARNGEYVWVRETGRLIYDDQGEPLYWQGFSFDVTAEKDAERSIRESEQRFRSLFDYHPDAVFSIDRRGRVLTANPAFVAMTGHDPNEIDELQFVDLVIPEDRERVSHRFSQTHQGESQEFHAAITGSTGDRTLLSITSIPIIVDEEIVGVHVVAQDVTIHQELENQLAHQAFHDSLTGLPNRNLFQSRLDYRLARSHRDGSRFAVLFFDLDDFKVINDSLGHSAGDRLLVEAAQRIQTCVRDDDVLARLGGDEFTLLLEHIRDEQDAILIAERIAKVLEDPFIVGGLDVFVTTSIGIALGDQHSGEPDDILRNADLAMYEAKGFGKNRYALFEPSMNSKAWLRLMLETEIRRALSRNEFTIYYQPIVELSSGDLIGVEALVRWNHPERGFLSPEQFITVAEQSGLILPLGRWIIDHATAQVRAWQDLVPGDRPLRLSLNLSSRQYQHPRLIEELSTTLERANLNAQLITLEITESIAMDDSPSTTETLLRLKEVGVQLALDDFGTGFSALSYLKRFPIDIIKIDQSFVDGLGTDAEDTSIVEAVMAAALAMNLHVTAEGVETRKQLEILRALGCHSGQGYLISRPLSAESMQRLLESRQFTWKDEIAALSNGTTSS